ncbi:hypothetical protein K435DRAFT_960926 [Dendrothele bispora CBS 962.96]|uniref:Uncharacterized protein n=1 Tax=Dendrothele bispora (strain CBS 962.96) TaxID=1314807 RepID=A0A4S8MT94_DENBC|nr:hypothetical protein K435DRAFT_960926 [Dendrothele bispora CBS 962.96]
MAPQVPPTISHNSHQASVIDVPDEAEPVVQISTRNTMPLDGLHSTAQTTASSLLRHRRSLLPIASRVGIGGVFVPAPTPTGTSITAHNANILRTVSTSANSLSPNITQNNLQFTETLQMFNRSWNNTFNDTTFTSPARDSYSFSGPVTLVVDPDLISQMLRTQSTGPQGLDSTPRGPITISDLGGPVSVRPRIDANSLDGGDGLEALTTGANRNRLRRLINGGVFRTQDTNDLIGPDPFFFCD